MGELYAVLSALMFAVNNVIIKKGIIRNNNTDNGFFITIFINVIFLGLLCLIAIAVKGWNIPFSWTSLIFFSLAGLCTTGIGRLTLFSSISYIGPSRASAIRNTTPIFTTLFAIFFLNETISLLPGVGMMLLMVGILNEGYSLRKTGTSHNQLIKSQESLQYENKQMFGYGLAILSAITFGVGQGLRKQGLLTMDHAFFGAWVGAMTSLVFVLIYQSVRGNLTSSIKGSFNSLNPYYLLAGLFTSLGPLFFFLATQSIQVSYVSVITSTEPIITVLISGIFLKRTDSITIRSLITISMISIGAILMVVAL
ncbi:DMT family transporter [Cytobacillus sp. Hm23]